MLNSETLCVVIEYSTWSRSIQPKAFPTRSSSIPRLILHTNLDKAHVYSEVLLFCWNKTAANVLLWRTKFSQFYGLGSLRPGLRNFTCLVQADVWFTLMPWMLHLQKRMNAVTSQSGVRGKKTKTTTTKTTHISFIWLFFYKCGIHSWLGDLLQSKHLTTGGINFNVISVEDEIIQRYNTHYLDDLGQCSLY